MLFFALKKVQMVKITPHQIPTSQQYSWTPPPLPPIPLIEGRVPKIESLVLGRVPIFLTRRGINMKREVM